MLWDLGLWDNSGHQYIKDTSGILVEEHLSRLKNN